MHSPRYFNGFGDELFVESWRPADWAENHASSAWCDDCNEWVQLDHSSQSRSLKED